MPPITAPLLLTPSVFLPLPKEIIVATSLATTSFGSSKKSSKKKKEILKVFLESLNNRYDEDEKDNSEASSEATIDPKREWFGNFGYSP